uniref:Uncharacterized protein n=1 Tax=viral metagenome TaxID=1070528 RepID=A0A6C0B5Z4_9ZZZZ
MTSIIYIAPENFTWKLYQMPQPLSFQVYRTVIDNISFYRPYEPIYRCEFEEFFHFGAHCDGYDINRVVIKNSQKSKYIPVTRVTVTQDGLWKLK